MRAVVVKKFGLDGLSVVEREPAEPGPGEVVVSMRAASLNYRDLLVVEGAYNPRQSLPLVPLSDGCGVVSAVGEGVTRVAVGDRVCPLFAQQWWAGEPTTSALRSTLGSPHDGVARDAAVFSEQSVVRVPSHLTDAEAATLPCAALTAWSALVTLGGLQAGQTVVVQGTGGVSLFGLQLAKLCGATVIVTSSSDEKLERVRALGADHVINYVSTPDWGKVVRKEHGGADHVIDVGGAQTLSQSMTATRPGGTVSVIGVLSGNQASSLNLLPMLMQQIRLQGVIVGHREGFEAMSRAIEVSKLRPVLDKRWELPELGAALSHMKAAAHFGKITIGIGDA